MLSTGMFEAKITIFAGMAGSLSQRCIRTRRGRRQDSPPPEERRGGVRQGRMSIKQPLTDNGSAFRSHNFAPVYQAQEAAPRRCAGSIRPETTPERFTTRSPCSARERVASWHGLKNVTRLGTEWLSRPHQARTIAQFAPCIQGRPMAPNPHLDYLDGWRGLAIFLLLVGHFFPIPGIGLGSLGVSLFFVLSGHLMAGLLFIKKTPLPAFYRRRISRVFPVHIIFISLISGIFFMSGQHANWSEIPTALLFVQNYFSGKAYTHTLPFGHIWSLAVEEHAYLVLSVVALLCRRKIASDTKMIALLVLGCIATGVLYSMRYVGAELTFDHWLRTEVSAYGILGSALLTVVFSRRGVPTLSSPTYLAIAVVVLATQWWSVPLPVNTFLGVGLLALVVNSLSTAPAFIKAALSWKPLRMMGLWSFSLYIWQQPFYARFTANDWTSQSTNFCMAMATGIISFYAIEQPARRWLNQHWSTSTQRPTGVGGQLG